MLANIKLANVFICVIVALQMVCMVESCFMYQENIPFEEFAKRSQLMVRARALTSHPANLSASPYYIKFRIFGLFPSRRGRFRIGQTITVGPFRIDGSCLRTQIGSAFILFLRIPELNQENYELKYKPIPYSTILAKYFSNVLLGRYQGEPILKSGCPRLRNPRNGVIRCDIKKVRCSISCSTNFILVGSKYKTCNVKSMRWFPPQTGHCTMRPERSSPLENLNRNLNNRDISLRFAPFRLIHSDNDDDYEEEEEEEEEEEPQFNRRSRKPPPQYLKYKAALLKASKRKNSEGKSKTSTQQSVTSQTLQTTQSVTKRAKASIDNIQTSIVSSTSALELTTVRVETNISSSDTTEPTFTDVDVSSGPPHGISPTSNYMNGQTAFSTHSTNSATTEEVFVRTNFNEAQNQAGINSYFNIQQTGDIWIGLDGTTNMPVMGLGSAIMGCPVYEGNLTLHSVWRGGFDGTTTFSNIVDPLMGGWMVRILFNIPVERLDTYTVEMLAASKSLKDFAFVPLHYNIDLYQDLTVGFLGRSSQLSDGFGVVVAKSFLLGLCDAKEIEHRNIGLMLPYDDANGTVSSAWIQRSEATYSFLQPEVETRDDVKNDSDQNSYDVTSSMLTQNTMTTALSTTTPYSTWNEVGRCSPEKPNSFLPLGVVNVIDWTRDNTHPFIDLNEILHKSILFYEAQRSGNLSMRNRISWRGDSDLKDGCSIGRDLSGGWYNAAGNVKTTSLIAFSVTLLSWGGIEYMDAYQNATEKANFLSQIRWATDYLIKSHVGPNQLVVQIGGFVGLNEDWNPPEDSDPETRTVHLAGPESPAADVAADVAAALASSSILFQEINRTYARICLQHAEELYSFARNFPDEYRSTIRNPQWPNPNNGLADDMSWAAAWLYNATKNRTYLEQAEEYFVQIDQSKNVFYWGDKARGIGVLLSKWSASPSLYKITTESYVRWILSSPHFSNSGLLWLSPVGTTMYAANAGFLLLQSIDLTSVRAFKFAYYNFAFRQIEIIHGGRQQGYVVGVGQNPPMRPHHRGSSCPSPPATCPDSILTSTNPNPHVLYGAVVSGPGNTGSYIDRVNNEMQNSVSITYNAGFQSLVAGLKQLSSRYSQQTHSL